MKLTALKEAQHIIVHVIQFSHIYTVSQETNILGQSDITSLPRSNSENGEMKGQVVFYDFTYLLLFVYFGDTPNNLKSYSWLCTQKFLLSRGTIWDAGKEPRSVLDQLGASQTPYRCTTTLAPSMG